MALRAAAKAAVFLAALTACKTNPKATEVSTDAGTDAAPPADASAASAADAAAEKPRERTLVAVAEGSADVRLFRTFDGRVLVMAGGLPYEGRDNGALEPLLAPPALGALFPEDDTFVGFLEPSMDVHWVYGELSEKGTLFLDGIAGKRKTLAFRDRKLAPAPTAFDARHVVRWRGKLLGANFTSKMNELQWLDDKSEAAPPPSAKIPIVTQLAVDAQGALYAFSAGPYETLHASVYPATWKPGDAPVSIDGPKTTSCTLVPSFDSSVVMRCSETSAPDAAKYFKPTSTGFERVFTDAPTDTSAASIGKDGALYVTFSKRLAVERCPAPSGKCTPVEVKADLAQVRTAHYEPSVSDVVERKGDDIGERNWTTIRVDAAKEKEEIAGSYAILARDENDIWLLARNYRRAALLHSTDDPARVHVRLPTRFDGRLIVKNASPPQAWTGHCEQVFVRLSADDVKKSAEIEKALGTKPQSYESAFHWWVVEGRLHEDKVSGVVIVHRDVEEALDKMERATEKLVSAFTDNPMRKPNVYCTLPVLDRVVHPTGSGT